VILSPPYIATQEELVEIVEKLVRSLGQVMANAG
jgi:adenosylmethionine-8-amino-7-oxononanoate aminotransferase